MGWNSLSELRGPLFEHIDSEEDMYFVHSYYAALGQDTIASTDYIFPFSCSTTARQLLRRPVSPGEICQSRFKAAPQLPFAMRIIPAIDLIDGACVRLSQGDYSQKTQYQQRSARHCKAL